MPSQGLDRADPTPSSACCTPRGEPDPALELQQWDVLAEGESPGVARAQRLLVPDNAGKQHGRRAATPAAVRSVRERPEPVHGEHLHGQSQRLRDALSPAPQGTKSWTPTSRPHGSPFGGLQTGPETQLFHRTLAFCRSNFSLTGKSLGYDITAQLPLPQAGSPSRTRQLFLSGTAWARGCSLE